MKKHSKPQNRLSLRAKTVKSLNAAEFGNAAGGVWTYTLYSSCRQVCATQECTFLPPCNGGGGGSLSGVNCPK